MAGPPAFGLVSSTPTASATGIVTAAASSPQVKSAADTAPVAVVKHGTTVAKHETSAAKHETAAAKPAASTTAAVAQRKKPKPKPKRRHRRAHSSSPATLRCTGTTQGPLPANYAAIVNFLVAHGYTGLAAAGVAGNIYQESGGNPESVGTGGGGLIGWTPLPPGFVTGNVAADLQTQLQALLTYNQQWAAYIPALNAATTATQAADIYMNDFERPGIPAAYNREAAANAVAQACGL